MTFSSEIDASSTAAEVNMEQFFDWGLESPTLLVRKGCEFLSKILANVLL